MYVTKFLNFHNSFKGGFYKILDCRLHEGTAYSLLAHPLKIIKMFVKACCFCLILKQHQYLLV